jgi:hypothetical protein
MDFCPAISATRAAWSAGGLMQNRQSVLPIARESAQGSSAESATAQSLCLATTQSPLRSTHSAPIRVDFGEKQIELGTTDGIHQRVNSRGTAAPNQRGQLSWGLLIAGLFRSAIGRPTYLLRRRLAGGDSLVSSFDETPQWCLQPGPFGFFGCGCRDRISAG